MKRIIRKIQIIRNDYSVTFYKNKADDMHEESIRRRRRHRNGSKREVFEDPGSGNERRPNMGRSHCVIGEKSWQAHVRTSHRQTFHKQERTASSISCSHTISLRLLLPTFSASATEISETHPENRKKSTQDHIWRC